MSGNKLNNVIQSKVFESRGQLLTRLALSSISSSENSTRIKKIASTKIDYRQQTINDTVKETSLQDLFGANEDPAENFRQTETSFWETGFECADFQTHTSPVPVIHKILPISEFNEQLAQNSNLEQLKSVRVEETNFQENLIHSGQDFDSDDSVKDPDYYQESASEKSSSEAENNLFDGTENNFYGSDENVQGDQNNRADVDEGDNAEVTVTLKKLTRKRIRQPEEWKKNQRKRLRNEGKMYINSKGKSVNDRIMLGPCPDSCRLKCKSKVEDYQRKEIFNTYWKLGCINDQRHFINSCMSEINPPYRNPKTESNRSKNYRYTLKIGLQPVPVCKTFFKNTLGINNRIIHTTTKKKDEQGFLHPDQRGRHYKQRKTNEEILKGIRDHLNSFPRVDLHYCRSRTQKEYLDGSLNISTMYQLYVAQCIGQRKEYAKLPIYTKTFNTETNVAFHKPKKDQCSLCENFKNSDVENQDIIQDIFEKHQKEKELSRKEKDQDITEDKNVVCFDLQAVLPTPCGDINSFFYKRRLATYNFTLFDAKQKLGFCYLRHEGIVKRGANEIGSCVLDFIKAYEGDHLVFYSDNCVGQNKNKFIFAMYLYCVLRIEHITSITHKFLIVGHSQNEGDSMHAAIEREKKRLLKSGPIYVPSQWVMVVKGAKKQGMPYKVTEIGTDDIIDVKKLASEIGNNYTVDENKLKINWNEIKCIRVEKENPYIIFYKTSYEQAEYGRINVRRVTKTRRSQQAPDNNLPLLHAAYKNPPGIPQIKKANLMELCRDNAIKSPHWAFYEQLRVCEAAAENENDNDSD